MTSLMSLQEETILERALDYLGTLSKEKTPILKCLGRTLAEDIVAPEALPPYDYSIVDGYALCSQMTNGVTQDNPKHFFVLGEVCAGANFHGVVQQNGTVQIMTGAPLPVGTDCVIPVEAVVKRNNLLTIKDEAYAGMNVRKAGSDVVAGSVVIKSGKIVSPLEIGVLASLGKGTAEIVRRPRVSIVATGDEVITLGRKKAKGQLFNSNAYCIASLVSSYGGIPQIWDVVPDDRSKLRDSIVKGFESDLLITIGGTSSGTKDFVSEVCHDFEEISFGNSDHNNIPLRILKGTDNRLLPHLVLPGKPVGCMVVFEFYGRPIVERMSGRERTASKLFTAIMQNNIINEGKANLYARVRLQKKQKSYLAWSTGKPDHDYIYPNVEANGFAMVPKSTRKVKAGDRVDVLIPGWSNI